GLDSDEWTLRSFRFTEQEDDVFVITSKRLIRSKSGWGKWHNWMIPLDKMESISMLTMSHPRSEIGDIWKGGQSHYIFYYALRFIHGKGKHLEHKDFWMPFEVTYKEQESIKEFVEELIRSRGAKPSLPVAIPEPPCPSCGHGNPSDAEFCVECGRQLK
ncbi:MAG: zinc ribbon domain-containing protein, partial [Promethearchaeota archaeon]